MVQEVRSILFNAEECRAAITLLMTMKFGVGRAGSVTRVELQGPKVSATVSLRSNMGVTQYVMDSAELMSAVLLFCRRSRIPLSTRSDKRLSLISNCLALTTSINLRPAGHLRSPGSTASAVSIDHTASGPDLALMHRV